MDYTDGYELPSTYYRVAAKGIIRDDAGRILAVADHTGTYELPGGGWEHDEDFETCLKREIKEELGVGASIIGSLLFTYRGIGAGKQIMLRIVAEAKLASHDFDLDNDEVTSVRFVGRDEFLVLNWCDEDREVVEHVDELWPPVEKKG